ncbi:MAG: RNA methyltransferase [Bacteroidales bacterium]|nr:RNA methyltransferase [Bacteroidales bacterium]
MRFKKYRDRNKLFVIEGDKLVSEFLAGGKKVRQLLALPEWIEKIDKDLLSGAGEIITVSERELKKISLLKTPNDALAIVDIEEYRPDTASLAGKLNIALDNIQDPANLGSIMRIAAWFGIEDIICSHGTVDVYNPKTVQSSMGAFLHVNVTYADLTHIIPELVKGGTPVYAATLDGENVFEIKKSAKGLLLFGNESKGISAAILKYAAHKISIAPAREALPGIDSLNVAMSAAIICSVFREGKHD